MNAAAAHWGTILLVIAIANSFATGLAHSLKAKLPSHPLLKPVHFILHLLEEIELLFAFWATVFLLVFVALEGPSATFDFIQTLHFGEAIFVFAIMLVCSSPAILQLARQMITKIAALIPGSPSLVFFATLFTLGPLLGSFITEPAAMTLCALLLGERYFSANKSNLFMYGALAVLFVNVSVGGTLTHFAAPPVLMVAKGWNWDLLYMLKHFGWKAVLTVLTTTAIFVFWQRKELQTIPPMPSAPSAWRTTWMQLKFSNALHVSIFLASLVVFGPAQRWWVEPLILKLESAKLFVGAVGLTALLDNAALTYFGSQVPDLSEISKYMLVAGSVVGGGLTIIANAPNPVGFGLLKSFLKDQKLKPFLLLACAIPPTAIAMLIFWFL